MRPGTIKLHVKRAYMTSVGDAAHGNESSNADDAGKIYSQSNMSVRIYAVLT